MKDAHTSLKIHKILNIVARIAITIKLQHAKPYVILDPGVKFVV